MLYSSSQRCSEFGRRTRISVAPGESIVTTRTWTDPIPSALCVATTVAYEDRGLWGLQNGRPRTQQIGHMCVSLYSHISFTALSEKHSALTSQTLTHSLTVHSLRNTSHSLLKLLYTTMTKTNKHMIMSCYLYIHRS